MQNSGNFRKNIFLTFLYRNLHLGQPLLRIFPIPDTVNILFPRRSGNLIPVFESPAESKPVCLTKIRIVPMMENTDRGDRLQFPEPDRLCFASGLLNSLSVLNLDIRLRTDLRIRRVAVARLNTTEIGICLPALLGSLKNKCRNIRK